MPVPEVKDLPTIVTAHRRSDSATSRHGRPSLLRDLAALATIAAIWGLAGAAALAVAALTRIGPIVIGLSYNHGVHSGDLMAGALFAGFAAVLSAMVVHRWRDPR